MFLLESDDRSVEHGELFGRRRRIEASSGDREQRRVEMRFGQAVVGDKMVFDTQGGVWEKIDNGRARLVFGKRDLIGSIVNAANSDFVYVINEKPADRVSQRGMVKVDFFAETELLTTMHMPFEKAALIAKCDAIDLDEGREVEVDKVGFKIISNEMVVQVI